ncbi:unnamed protein product [Brassica rapa subsp. trilocularis]
MEIRDSGYRITDELMCVLIGSWGKLNIGRSVKLFAEVQENGLSPDVYAYNALMLMRKVKKAEELIKTMLRIGLKPDNFTYSGLIKSFK